MTANKEVTESRASMGNALVFDQIKPSGTLGYRIVKRLFDLVFSLLMSVLLLIPVAVVVHSLALNLLAALCMHRRGLARAERQSRSSSFAAWSPMLAMCRSI